MTATAANRASLHERAAARVAPRPEGGGKDVGGSEAIRLGTLKTRPRFGKAVLAVVRDGKMLAIRAGMEHRFIGIWAVVVEGRVFARSWSLKPRSWWRTFLEDPRGAIQVSGKVIPVRAVQTRSERLKDAVSRAYADKYHTPGSLKYVRDMARPRSRETTTELVPL